MASLAAYFAFSVSSSASSSCEASPTEASSDWHEVSKEDAATLKHEGLVSRDSRILRASTNILEGGMRLRLSSATSSPSKDVGPVLRWSIWRWLARSCSAIASDSSTHKNSNSRQHRRTIGKAISQVRKSGMPSSLRPQRLTQCEIVLEEQESLKSARAD